MLADINQLRALMQSGQITEDDLRRMALSGAIGGSRNALAAAGQPVPEPDQDFIRNESTGSVTYLPRPAERAIPRYRMVGAGNGEVVDLGQGEGALPPVDVSRGTIEIPGVGRGQYSRDGRYAIVDDGQGGKVKVVLGYDRAGSMRATKQDLEMQRARAELEQTNEATLRSREERSRRENPELIPGAGYSQAFLEKQYGKAPDGTRWRADGTAEGIPGGNAGGKGTEDEKRSAGLAIRMANALRDMESKPEGAKPQVLPEILRNIPLIGEAAANAVTPYERQTVEAAQLDALDAALTLATGAAYTKEQLKGLAKSYFPQLGDDDRTIEDKRARLEDVISTARIRAGQRAGDIDKVTGGRQAAPRASGMPRVGEIRKGYEYLGGPPGSPGSWRKVQAR